MLNSSLVLILVTYQESIPTKYPVEVKTLTCNSIFNKNLQKRGIILCNYRVFTFDQYNNSIQLNIKTTASIGRFVRERTYDLLHIIPV